MSNAVEVLNDSLSFSLFGEGGFINPTLWSFAVRDQRRDGSWETPFYDQDTNRMYTKQTKDFDGGWRWFESYARSALTIYNIKLDRRAHTDITYKEIESGVVSAEFILLCAKARVLVDHTYFSTREYVLDYIRDLAWQTSLDIATGNR